MKLNKPDFKKTIIITIGYMVFMLITQLIVKPDEVIKVIISALLSGAMVWMLLYFMFMIAEWKSGK